MDKRSAPDNTVETQNALAVCGDEPTFDANGYPTEETEATIREWDYKEGYHSLMAYIARAWRYPDYFQAEGETYKLSTGGWSGNEQLIGALERNRVFWALCWESSTRGGHYVFTVSFPSVPSGTENHLAATPLTKTNDAESASNGRGKGDL